ncbi:uncharacterized protein LOC112684464 [Sipha flava]|uniref:Uncharacterized protein LOC112684464 n=1 Tax=Sipha flava TaxID=143950 RepID=A0A8B8FMT8_9HEMI|nr:uncharacterized protein LOC112684464 [Sipha flava]
MFSITFFLCIALIPIFTEADINYGLNGNRLNTISRNIADLEAKKQYLMNQLPPPPPGIMQPIIRPRFQREVMIQRIQPPMLNNDYKEPILLLVMSAYSRLLALTQLAMQSLVKPPITDPQTAQSPINEKTTIDATQTVNNGSIELQKKPLQKDEEQENPSSKEIQGTNLNSMNEN